MACVVLMAWTISGVCCFDGTAHRSSVVGVGVATATVWTSTCSRGSWWRGYLVVCVIILMAQVIGGVCVVTATVWTSTCSRGSWWQCATDPTACLTTRAPLRDSRQRPTSRSEPLFSTQHFIFFPFLFYLLFCFVFVLS